MSDENKPENQEEANGNEAVRESQTQEESLDETIDLPEPVEIENDSVKNDEGVDAKPITVPDNDLETVELAKPKEIKVVTEEDIAVAAAEEYKTELVGSKDYNIRPSFKDTVKLTDEKLDLYPLVNWTRDSKMLSYISRISQNKLINGQGTDSDYQNSDLANQCAVILDPHMEAFFAEENADWDNCFNVDDRKVRSSRVNYATKTNGGTLAGENREEQLFTVLSRRLELGTPLLVRLWHSGLSFVINPTSKDERIQLVDKLNAAHLETLRRTNGIVHGSSSYYANRILVRQFIKQAVNSNIDRNQWADINSLIDHRDIQIIAWALLAASHQRGYPYTEVCGGLKVSKDADGNEILGDDGKVKKTVCMYTKNAVIDLMLMIQIDNSKFTTWQKEFISRPINDANKVSVEDIKTYQSQGDVHKVDHVEIAEGISLVIGAPTVDKHIDIGEKWIETVETSVDDAIMTTSDEETRNEMINSRLEATAILDVAHWVRGFIIDGEEVLNEDQVFRQFRYFSNNETINEKAYEAIRKLTVKRLGAVPAIPTEVCPECGNLSSTVNNNGSRIYTPIDTVARFFILATKPVKFDTEYYTRFQEKWGVNVFNQDHPAFQKDIWLELVKSITAIKKNVDWKLDGFDLAGIKRQLFHMMFLEQANDKALETILYNDSEHLDKYDSYAGAFVSFSNAAIAETANMSFDEYLKYPNWFCDWLVNDWAPLINKKETTKLDAELEKELMRAEKEQKRNNSSIDVFGNQYR